MRRISAAPFVVPASVLLVLACSKSSTPEPGPNTVSKRVLPGSVPLPAPPPAPTDGVPPSSSAAYAGHPFIDYDGAPLTYTVIEKIDAASIKPDPDLAVVDAARAAGAGCFASLTGGPDVRYAVIQVVVVPTGTVSRAEVSGVSEPEVIDCLRRVGTGLHFSDRTSTTNGDNGTIGIRSFSIDIHVARPH
jgi:hypothetical protein